MEDTEDGYLLALTRGSKVGCFLPTTMQMLVVSSFFQARWVLLLPCNTPNNHALGDCAEPVHELSVLNLVCLIICKIDFPWFENTGSSLTCITDWTVECFYRHEDLRTWSFLFEKYYQRIYRNWGLIDGHQRRCVFPGRHCYRYSIPRWSVQVLSSLHALGGRAASAARMGTSWWRTCQHSFLSWWSRQPSKWVSYRSVWCYNSSRVHRELIEDLAVE